MTLNYKKLGELLKKSVFLSFKWTFWKWFSTAGFGALISLIPIIKDWLHLNTYHTIIVVILITLITLYLLRFVFIFFKELVKYFFEVYRDSAYGNAIILLKDGFAESHLYRKTPGVQEEEFMKIMITFCDNLKSIFDQITRSNCSVSIKIPVKEKNVGSETNLKTLTRDKSNRNRDTVDCEKVFHTILGNSAFSTCLNKVITNQREKYYIKSDVNNDPNYLNTFKNCFTDNKLPFKDLFVYPIVPIKQTDNRNFNCNGFICIDSDKIGVFENKYIVPLIEGVADGIYDLFVDYNDRNESEQVINNELKLVKEKLIANN